MARRKLDSVRSNILTKYFALGGIEASAKAFNGGLDKETLDNSTAAEIAAIRATDFVRSSNSKYYDPSDTENWVVDWEGIVRGFLSHRAVNILGDGEDEMQLYCAVLRNFLNYVLAHEVCKEYTKDVMAARKICDVAEKEYKSIRHLRQMFPGDFNVAASTMFGKTYKLHMEANLAWGGVGDGSEEWFSNIPLLSLPVCQFVFGGIVALIGDKSQFEKAKKGDIHVVKTETRFLEAADVHHAPADIVEEFSRIKDPRGSGALKPIGKLLCKQWEGPGYNYEDRTDDGNDEVVDDSVEEFWLEDEILQHCYPGLKLEVVVQELNIGVKYFDQVLEVFPSFHLYLPNEKMMGWKEPGKFLTLHFLNGVLIIDSS
ncbi:hypothetical protein DSL72_005807 [Monilinia vaccinii-corymbosi]|uniref:Uncharacterized protein n=1 Tax=Monilinia vaccinii-corymbosi TaxID=61207 RepID=A0A8A3PG43_9HELO|nr:hypothetical protein DSL72_005807 [Monilinia vaccinii-corymbosi]